MTKHKLAKVVYIDALALIPEKKSGVGITLENTLDNLIKISNTDNPFSICLVVPLGKAKYLNKYKNLNINIKTIYLPARLLAFLMRVKLLPPVDWFLGSGVYLFPNYRNWPLWRSRSITYVYDISFILFPDTVQPKNQRYLIKNIKHWVERTDRVVTISEHVGAEIEKHLDVPYTKLSVVYCGVNLDLFLPQSDQTKLEKLKDEYDIPKGKYVIYIGNIEPRKNLTSLVRAYSDLPDKLKQQYGLVIVGSDSWLNESFENTLINAQSNGDNILKIKNYVPKEHLPYLYSGSSLLVHPAIYEGFGLTLLEAMACAVPLAVSDIPVLREIIGNSAFFFDPNDKQSITETIHKALTSKSLSQQYVDDGLVRVKDFTWQNTASSLINIINDEFEFGTHKHPVLKRLKSIYQKSDRSLRALMGDKNFEAYYPKKTDNFDHFRNNIYDDFAMEQPSHMQYMSLNVYQNVKHLVSDFFKKIYRGIRKR